MDDLYEDLENYDDVNLVNELKSENAELRMKLNENTTKLDKLQNSILQDFDKLEAEFKTLEKNYSSLLQIARAEIKRKTDMIATLNKEKDMLMINSFKDAPHRRKHVLAKTNSASNVPTEANPSEEKSKINQTVNTRPKKQITRHPSEDTSSSATDNTNRLTIVENKTIGNVEYKERNIETKETEVHVFPSRKDNCNELKLPANDLLDRRKSLSRLSNNFKLSSDEEFEDIYSALAPKSISPYREHADRVNRVCKRLRDDQLKTKSQGYDTSSLEDKYHSDYRNRNYKSRSNRYYDDERRIHRNFDTHKKKNSPERYRRGYREYGDDHYAPSYDRHRRLESPPQDRNRNRSRDRRPYYEREKYQKHEQQYKYRDPVQSKIHGEYDEPVNKRARVDSYKNTEEEKRPVVQTNEAPTHEIRDMQYISCQSPDYMHSEHVSPSVPIPEIKTTAITKLEDPRVTSGKYINSLDGNREVLCSSSSSHVDLVCVDKSLWNLPPLDIPDGLKNRPNQFSDDMVNEIYMDIENPVSNLSMESGEIIGSESNDRNYDEIPQFHERNVEEMGQVKNCKNLERINAPPLSIHKVTKKTNNPNSPKEEELNNPDEISKELKSTTDILKSYKIPKKGIAKQKIDKPETLKNCPSNVSTNVHLKSGTRSSEDVVVSNEQPLNRNKTSVVFDEEPSSQIVSDKPSETSKESGEENLQHKENVYKSEKIDTNTCREFEYKILSTREIVAGDLELSDETNDIAEHKAQENENIKKKHKSKKKSHRDTSKEKQLEKDAGPKKTIHKFTELFGDSSSLITPEDLEIATSQAHAKTSDTYVPIFEDAQDGTNMPRRDTECLDVTSKSNIHPKQNIQKLHVSIPIVEETLKLKLTKDSHSRSQSKRMKKQKDIEITEESCKERTKDNSAVKILKSDEEQNVSSSKINCSNSSTEKRDTNKSTSTQDILDCSNNSKEKIEIDNMHNNVEMRKKQWNETHKENNDHNIINKTIDPIKRLENIIYSDMPKTGRENVNRKSSSTTDNFIENVPSLNKEKETPNLKEAIADDPGLVKTVVISSGTQPSVLSTQQLNIMGNRHSTIEALATSTPSKASTSIDVGLENDHSLSHVGNVPQADDSCKANTVNSFNTSDSQVEAEVPDVRISFVRKRRRVLKK